jgi:CHASE2 domain-containing sensor protein
VIRPREADPKRFFLLALLAALGIAFLHAMISYLLFESDGDSLPNWPKLVATFVAFAWVWKITGMYTVLRIRERLGLRWLL